MAVIRNDGKRKKTKIDEKTYDASVLVFYLAMLYVRNYRYLNYSFSAVPSDLVLSYCRAGQV